MVAEPQKNDPSVTVDSDSGEISGSGSSTDDNDSEATDSDEEPDSNDGPQMDIIPDLPSHLGHSEAGDMQRQHFTLPHKSWWTPGSFLVHS